MVYPVAPWYRYITVTTVPYSTFLSLITEYRVHISAFSDVTIRRYRETKFMPRKSTKNTFSATLGVTSSSIFWGILVTGYVQPLILQHIVRKLR
jgi:hypothetical protein